MATLRKVALTSAVVTCIGLGARAAQDGPARVQVTGTQLTLVPPANFEPADRFPGFVGPNASIQVTEIAGPLKEVSAGFTNPEMMKKQNMTFLASESIALQDGTPALWVHIRQSYRGEAFLKWIVLFGNQAASVMVVATVAEQEAPGAESALRLSLLSAHGTQPRRSPP